MVDVDDYGLQLTNSRIHSLNCVYKVISVLFVVFYLVLANSNMDMYMIDILFILINVYYCPFTIPPTSSLFSIVVSVFFTLALSLPNR